MISYIAYLPHPPIMLPAIGGTECLKIAETIESQKKVSAQIKKLENNTDLLVVMSPHAPAETANIPIYSAASYTGSLANFGQPDLKISFPGNPLEAKNIFNFVQKKVAVSFQEYPVLDHGVSVPLFELFALHYNKPILVTGLNISAQKQHYIFGQQLAAYAKKENKKIVFLGSGDMSHALKADGPYAYHPAGPAFDSQIVKLIKKHQEKEFLNIDAQLQEEAAECGFRSLLTIAGLLQSIQLTGEVLSYEGPFGVGYLSAQWQ